MDKLLLVDVDKCTGCRTCENFCALKHTGEGNPARSLIKSVRYEKLGSYYFSVPVICQQCETPMCMEICPMNAISKDSKTGAYLVNANVCSGCRLCTVACPSGAIEIDSVKKIAVKCDLCGGEPLCAKNCLAGAITFVEKDKAGLIRKREAIQKMSDRLILIAGEAEK